MAVFWEVTKLMLQGEEPLIKRPKLTEQLLNKPPFRFLHDIISEVTRTTGFAEGLYTEEELVSANIKDKDGKVTYLTKIINCVGLALGQNVPARPLKIVAGLEPENTNKLLQMLAQAATSGGAASQLAVQKVLAGEQMPAKSAADRSQRTSESQPPASQPEALSSDEPAPRGNLVSPPSSQSEAQRVSEHQRGQSAQGSRPGSVQTSAAQSADRGSETRAAQNVDARAPQNPDARLAQSRMAQSAETRAAQSVEAAAMRPSSANVAPAEPVTRTSAVDMQGATVRSSGAQQQQRPPPAASSEQAPEDEEAPRRREDGAGPKAEPSAPVVSQPSTSATPQRPGTANRGPLRPQSARRGPPKQPSNVTPVEKIPETKPLGSAPRESSVSERPGTARKSGRDAPQPPAPVRAGVILDGTNEDDDEEVVTVVDSQHVAATEAAGLSEGAGKLVRDILESRKGMENGDGGLGNTLKSGSMKKEELERLRGVVQYLCQSAMPLGKSMEYLQEDMENMAKEFQFWNKEKKAHAVKLEEERRLTQEALQGPLAQMAELEDEIKQKREALDMLKAQVFRNEETIEGLLKLVMAGPGGGNR